MLENLKTFLIYILGTATGGLLTAMVLGGTASLWTSDPVYFFVTLTGFLVNRASLETSNIVVIDKEEFNKKYNKEE